MCWVFTVAQGLSPVARSGRPLSSCGDREGYSPAAGCRLLLAAASLVAKFGLQGTRTSVVVAEGLVAPQHVGSSGPRMELVSPALAGGFLTT